MKQENIILIAIGAIVLFAIYKLRPQTVAVPSLVPVSVSGGEASDSRDPARVSAFDSLASLGAAQINALTDRAGIAASLESELEQTSVERQRIEAESAFASFNLLSEERRQIVESSLARDLAEMAAQVQTFQIGSDRAAAESLAGARLAEIQMQINALNNVASTYRNQSLERQGTIFNAYTSVFGAGAPYNYQSAFGRQSQTVGQQIAGVLQGAGGILSRFFG